MASPSTTTRPSSSSAAADRRPTRLALVLLGALLAAACAFSSAVFVQRHRISDVRDWGAMGYRDLDEVVARPFLPELIAWIEARPAGRRDEPLVLDAYGRALAAVRRWPEARAALARARENFGPSSPRGSASAWAESQAAFAQGDTAGALAAARIAHDGGFPVPDGWFRFLEVIAAKTPKLNRVEGRHGFLPFRLDRKPRLPQVTVAFGEVETEAIVDTGAAMTLVSESTAAALGLVPFEGTDAEGSGLHGTRFPVRFALAPFLDLAGVIVHDVPVGVVPDDALEFEGPGETIRFGVLLGCHLWKDFRVTVDYPAREIRLEPVRKGPTPGDLARANLFLLDNKPVVRGSLNGVGWFRFLVDTGSEFSLVHRAGAARFGPFLATLPVEPILVHGIGKSRSQWGKVSGITLGADAWQVYFKDILMTDDGTTPDDAILGTSFLENFVVTLDFGRLHVTLDRPELGQEWLPRASGESQPPPGAFSPGRSDAP